MKSKLTTAVCLVAAALLSSCGGAPVIGGAQGLEPISLTALPTPQRSDVTDAVRPFFIGPYDRLVIDVFGIPELSNREVQVDSEGRISFPLVGVINAAGKTPAEIEQEITAGLARADIREPYVSVNLKEVVSQRITVEGEVEKPGIYPVNGPMTLLRAIAVAEGTTEFSKLNDVVVFRTVGGKRYAALYNLDAIRHGRYDDPEIFPGDIVMVGESRGRRLFKDVIQTVPAFLTPIVISIDRLSN